MLSNIRSEDEDLDIVIFTESDAIDLNGSGSNDLATQDYEVREEVTQPSRTSPRSNIATAFQKMSANVSESAAKAKDFIKEKAYREPNPATENNLTKEVLAKKTEEARQKFLAAATVAKFSVIKGSTVAKENVIKGSAAAKENVIKGTAAAKENVIKGTAAAKEKCDKAATVAKENVIKGSTVAKENVIKGTAAAKENVIKGTAAAKENVIKGTMAARQTLVEKATKLGLQKKKDETSPVVDENGYRAIQEEENSLQMAIMASLSESIELSSKLDEDDGVQSAKQKNIDDKEDTAQVEAAKDDAAPVETAQLLQC
uniref:Uncharacterized protein n=2 Tax=Corethron hystrix TaxID=216773 RepID=A0A7S1FXZ2_9STRA|mmetsp:Transcript_38037/g.88489  ORF Transcript_38037/g.88489 Transcript_38037/m.88489 type:complete len:315 (+) Transcript_38037:100-1044(+)